MFSLCRVVDLCWILISFLLCANDVVFNFVRLESRESVMIIVSFCMLGTIYSNSV
ncbi:hypothetical protein RchiOBHm_Chr5g0036221 [Rosa chinensis]|uniref:Uncharacterized protein n=1 Tax=Rosa chinensis TaxID=74649 RepID=A0A2P6QBF0_ROSCH|nr:hypothetical protein RchiOBHm_Chr5g0036221 [Rosa chinensis]